MSVLAPWAASAHAIQASRILPVSAQACTRASNTGVTLARSIDLIVMIGRRPRPTVGSMSLLTADEGLILDLREPTSRFTEKSLTPPYVPGLSGAFCENALPKLFAYCLTRRFIPGLLITKPSKVATSALATCSACDIAACLVTVEVHGTVSSGSVAGKTDSWTSRPFWVRTESVLFNALGG
jgi:hypothetical protein